MGVNLVLRFILSLLYQCNPGLLALLPREAHVVPDERAEDIVIVGVGIPQEVRVERGSGGGVSEVEESQMGCNSRQNQQRGVYSAVLLPVNG